jgi:hypothetical protein
MLQGGIFVFLLLSNKTLIDDRSNICYKELTRGKNLPLGRNVLLPCNFSFGRHAGAQAAGLGSGGPFSKENALALVHLEKVNAGATLCGPFTENAITAALC